MYLNDLFKKNINIYIINFNKKDLHYFIGINSLLNYLTKIYEVFIYFYDIENFDNYNEEFFKMIFNYNINYSFLGKNNKNNNSNQNDNQLLFLDKKNSEYKNINYINNKININEINNNNKNFVKIIDFKKVENIKYLFETIFNVPYSLRFSNKNIFRFIDAENNLYNYHLNKFNNFPYIFCSSYYHLKESNYAVYIFLYNFYKSILDFENPFFKSWYYNKDPFYIYGKIIENSEELYIHIDDIEWLELCSILDLSKIKSKNIYYNKKNIKELNNLKNNIFLFDWNLILLD